MTEYSRMAKGKFTSTGSAQVINLPFQPDAVHAHTWLHGDLEDAHKNSAYFFADREWKYTWYFNVTEHGTNTLAKHVGLSVDKIDYDHCNLYRPPMWRLFVEMSHAK